MIGILQAQEGAGMTENLQVIGRMKMSLQFIIGSSGSGKSCYAYQNIIEQAGLHPEKLFLCDRAGAVYHADPEDTGGDESGQRNPEY